MLRRPETVSEESLLKPLYKRVSEIMYERLQSEICQRAVAEIRKRQSPWKFEQVEIRFWTLFREFQLEVLSKEIRDIFQLDAVQAEIRECITEEIYVLIPKLEKMHVELVKKIQEYVQNQEALHQYYLNLFDFFYPFGRSHFEYIQEEALCYELTLEKLHQRSNIIELIHQRVFDALCYAAREQFTQWMSTKQDIDKLYLYLSSDQLLAQPLSIMSMDMDQSYRIPKNKPLPKLQLKYSGR